MDDLWWTGPDKLDADQKTIVGLPATGRYFVTGPAGCGKTNMLALRAKRLSLSGPNNFAVLVYNGPLERFLSSHHKHGVDPAKVSTFISWMQKQLWDNFGVQTADLPSDMKERRAALSEKMNHFLDTSGKRGLIDTLLVDEVQDYTQKELLVLGKIATNLFFVGDIRQQIWHTTELQGALNQLFPLPNQQIHLVKHYRTGLEICRLADRISKPSKGHKPIVEGCQYREDLKPSRVRCERDSLEDQIAKTIATVRDQLDAYRKEFIGIMCPRVEDSEKVGRALMAAFPGKVAIQKYPHYTTYDAAQPIVCSTLHLSKGLEYRCVHILAAEGLRNIPQNRELIYTGVTRARTTLDIRHGADLYPYLADALAGPPKPTATLDELFE